MHSLFTAQDFGEIQVQLNRQLKEGDTDRYYGSYSDFSSPFIMAVEHDYIPISCGYSVNVNLALLMSQGKRSYTTNR